MIKKNQVTLIIQPDWQNKRGNVPTVRKLIFPKRVFYSFSFLIFLFIVLGAAGGWTIRNNLIIKSKIKKTETEINSRQSLYNQVSEIRKEVRIIRDFLGKGTYNESKESKEQMGMGGSDPDESLVLTPLDIEKEHDRLNCQKMNKPLHSQVIFLKNNILEVHTLISSMTEKLRHKPTIMPAVGNRLWISSGFGWRKSPFTGLRKFHYGLDISSKRGTPIITTADGVIEKTGSNRFIGNYVTVKHDEVYSTSYGHLLKDVVEKGQVVKRGDVIGLMGSTGLSTGNHLHYVVNFNGTRVNPYEYVLNRKDLNIAASAK